MISQETFQEVKKRLIKVYDPVEIYLFGSYAWGKPTEDSDLDLLIIVNKSDKKSFKRPIPGYDALFNFGISKDLIIYTKEEFQKYSNDVTTLDYKIKKDGKLIYARA